MKIFIPGGAGYVGSKLVPSLMELGYHVVVYDLFLYNQTLFQDIQNPLLTLIKGDVRDTHLLEKSIQGCKAVIHLACISNDPSFELNPQLGKSINLDSFEPFVRIAKKSGIQQFIYASSSSVYGIKKESNVTEEMSLEPLTDYSRFKADCEKILFEHMDGDFTCTVVRPATVCGYAPRQRLDVVVNILTNLAYHTGKIKVMGGEQLRPNLHIKDMVRAYIHLLNSPKERIQGKTFNVGYENYSVSNLGALVKKQVEKIKPVDLEFIPTNDQRSYHISSKKIQEELEFYPQYTIEKAVAELVNAFEKKLLTNTLEDERYFNVKRMKNVNLQ